MSVLYVFLAKGNKKILSRTLREYAVKRLIKGEAKLYTDPYGKPRVLSDERYGISVTHTDDIVCVAIQHNAEIGIDAEMIKDTYPERIPERFFSINERNEVRDAQTFYRVWCRKESYVKMTGKGIGDMSYSDTYTVKAFFRKSCSKFYNFILSQ